MTAFETDLLSDLICRKHKCLTQLRDMGQKQLELVRAGTMAELLDVLSAKHRLLARLQRIERALIPFRGQNPDQRHWRTDRQRQQSAQRLQQCESLLSQIMAQETQSEHQLTQRRDQLATQLQGLQRSGEASVAYAAQSYPRGGQLDLSSEC